MTTSINTTQDLVTIKPAVVQMDIHDGIGGMVKVKVHPSPTDAGQDKALLQFDIRGSKHDMGHTPKTTDLQMTLGDLRALVAEIEGNLP